MPSFGKEFSHPKRGIGKGKKTIFFVYFHPFINTMTDKVQKLTINGRIIDGVLGIRTQDRRIVGADESTELVWPPFGQIF